MSIDQMPVDQMFVRQLLAGQMSDTQMFFDQKAWRKKCLILNLNDWRLGVVPIDKMKRLLFNQMFVGQMSAIQNVFWHKGVAPKKCLIVNLNDWRLGVDGGIDKSSFNEEIFIRR
jgi:hypothetical protein